MSTIRHIAVVIPARDEETLLPRCLRSVLAARKRLPAGISSDVVLVSDCCSDRTVPLARKIIGSAGVVLSCHAGVVGVARSLGVKTALARYSGPSETCWLANTDADCEVPETWLADQLSLAERGIVAIAGIVSVDCWAEHLPHVSERFRQTYLLYADGTHPHVHGANMGVRGDVYLMAGGWGGLATAEDHDLWRRIGALGVERISDSQLCVTTSGRRIGRAPAGFAGALAAHNESAA